MGARTVKTITFSDEELRLMREQLKAMNDENNRLKDELATSNKDYGKSGGNEYPLCSLSGHFPDIKVCS